MISLYRNSGFLFTGGMVYSTGRVALKLRTGGSMGAGILSQDIDNLSTEQIDRYLEYIYEEEKKGTRFFEVTELLEEITDYTKSTLPHLSFLWITNKPWIPTVFALFFWCMLLAIPIAHLIDVINGEDTFSILKLSVFAVILIIYGYGFFKFRKIRKGNAA